MEKFVDIDFLEYGPALKKHGFDFVTVDKWHFVGIQGFDNTWLLYFTIQPSRAFDLFDMVLPSLKKYNICFSIIKNQLYNYQLNAGHFGMTEVGKVITAYISKDEEQLSAINTLIPSLEHFDGPGVPFSFKIGFNLYGNFSKTLRTRNNKKEIKVKLLTPRKKRIPFKIDSSYKNDFTNRNLLTRYFLPIRSLRISAKGNVTEVISLREKPFRRFVVKEAKCGVLCDHLCRDAIDRLDWQAIVMQSMSRILVVPEVIETFSLNDNKYLVMRFLNGRIVSDLVKRTIKNICWKKLPQKSKQFLLWVYAKILNAIQILHESGYIHRDITDSNFILTPNGEIGILDFEMSYDYLNNKPNPPFILGTIGYVSPEQISYSKPDLPEDIYSLGALLAFFCTGILPKDLLVETKTDVYEKLIKYTNDIKIVQLITSCLSELPLDRPGIKQIKLQLCDIISKQE